MNQSFQSVIARYELGLLLPEDLADVATQLISSGKESKSLVQLATLSRDDTRDARKLLECALHELGYPKITKKWAMSQFAQDVSKEIIAGAVSPLEGAKLIWKTCRDKCEDETHDYDPFIYAASEMEDRPRHFRHFEKCIMNEALKWSKRNIAFGEAEEPHSSDR